MVSENNFLWRVVDNSKIERELRRLRLSLNTPVTSEKNLSTWLVEGAAFKIFKLIISFFYVKDFFG